MRAALLVPALVATLVTGCGAAGHGRTSQVVRAGASPAPVVAPTATTAATPAAHSAPAAHSTTPARSAPDAVAVPTCLQPEVRPDWWTPSCGDAGYQLDMQWDSWTNTAATAHGRANVTHGADAGKSWPMRVVFDRPVRVRAMANRVLFSRAVVTYRDGPGPSGTTRETFTLDDVWRQAADIASTPVDPCATGSDGVSNCAPDLPSPVGTGTAGGQ